MSSPGSASETGADDASQLEFLTDRLSHLAHANWQRERKRDGWRYDVVFDARQKTDPRLTAFDQLHEQEQQSYHRQSSEILLEILNAGYRIHPAAAAGHRELLDQAMLQGLRFRELYDLYRRNHHEWRGEPRNFLHVGEQLLQHSEPVTAYEVFHAGMEATEQRDHGAPGLRKRLLQKAAQSLSDAMALEEAERLLTSLYGAGARDGETMGLLAKVHKKRGIVEADPRQMERAHSLYAEGFEEAERADSADDAIYNGINAATMARLAGDCESSAAIAGRVRELCLGKTARSYWDHASLGECSLLESDLEGAAEWYRRACDEAPLRDRLSMWQQARLIADRLEFRANTLARVFDPPTVVVFCGHRIDDDGRDFPRFPLEAEEDIRKLIRERLVSCNAGFCYSSLASGSDILFAEEALASGAELHLYLPFPAPLFADEFVASAGDRWLQRFHTLLQRADTVTTVSHWDIGLNDKSHQFCNLYILGAAMLQHRRTGCELQGVAVWDGAEGSRSSGTAATIAGWRAGGIEFSVISPPGGPSAAAPEPTAETEDGTRHPFLPMLFADVKGYSQLSGLQLYIFSQRFMDACATVLDEHRAGVFSTRTAGDGLFIVFRDLQTAIDSTRALRDMIATTDWSRSGLPRDLAARFALDCGPCYSYEDPVTGRTELCGAHVIRAARLEPVTPPGHIYVSESFATLCAANLIDASFEAVGRVVLPKNYGEMRVYYLN